MSNLSSTLIETVEQTIKNHETELNKNLYQFEKNKLYAYLEDLVDSLKKHKAYIAGGTITSLFTGAEINDIDIYFRDEKSLIDFLEDHWMDGKTFVTCLTKKSVLMVQGENPDYKNLQLIHFKYFHSAEEIFNTFDFTVCMGAFDFESEQFTLHPSFMKHNSQRILKFNKDTAFPIVSLLRVHKYNNKKYTISKPEFIRILLKCMTLDVDAIEKLKDQLGGMYGINYDQLINLDEGEEFSLDLFIDKIADISLSEEYFKKPVEMKFDDLDDIIDVIKKQPIKITQINNTYYKISHDNQLKKIEGKPTYSIEIDPAEAFSKVKFYKWVKKVGEGNYRSHHDNGFVYEDGKKSTAKNEKLWLLMKQNFDSGHYSRSGVLIEVVVKSDDFISISGNEVYAKACTVVREVPKTEWDLWSTEDAGFYRPF